VIRVVVYYKMKKAQGQWGLIVKAFLVVLVIFVAVGVGIMIKNALGGFKEYTGCHNEKRMCACLFDNDGCPAKPTTIQKIRNSGECPKDCVNIDRSDFTVSKKNKILKSNLKKNPELKGTCCVGSDWEEYAKQNKVKYNLG